MGTVKIKYCKEKDYYYFNLPNNIMSKLGWGVGDTIDWTNNNDGTFTLTKIIENTQTLGGETTIINFKCS